MTIQNEIEPISRTYVSQGLKLHYLDWGNDAAPVLLMLHGIRDHARSWDWAARALRLDWHVVAPDLRGHGDSQWSADGAYLASYHVLDIADLIETIGCDTLTIIGHSFGGNIVARYAALAPGRVRKLALVDAMGPTPDTRANWEALGPVKRTTDWIARRRAAQFAVPKRFATLEQAVARMQAANPHLSAEQAHHLAVHGVRHHADGFGWKYDPLVNVFPPEDFSADTIAVWREITCPTLLCWGPQSWTTNPELDGRAQHFRDRRTVVFENAGHWIHHDQFDGFMELLREFL